ncbi:MAG: hypothetical protein ABL931_17280 [Usitatibacteraceae bacterium]
MLAADRPYGNPSFGLSGDQVATVIDLVCRGAETARSFLTPGMLEVPITVLVRKAMRVIKTELGLSALEVRGEHELENMAMMDSSILGRIDITLKFMHQFGIEDAYVAVECKRLSAQKSDLSTRYVTEGMARFASGQYAKGHQWGFMLGYVLALPIDAILAAINKRAHENFGDDALLETNNHDFTAIALRRCRLTQADGHTIEMMHLFVDMQTAS